VRTDVWVAPFFVEKVSIRVYLLTPNIERGDDCIMAFNHHAADAENTGSPMITKPARARKEVSILDSQLLGRVSLENVNWNTINAIFCRAIGQPAQGVASVTDKVPSPSDGGGSN
jgi:hypothetical protein